MKMYIIVKDDIPDKLVPVIAAHASLACYKKFESNEDMIKWISGIFKKVVRTANETEFAKLKNEADFVLLTESYLLITKKLSGVLSKRGLFKNV